MYMNTLFSLLSLISLPSPLKRFTNMVYRNRSETIQHTDIVRLKSIFKDQNNNPVDLDQFPTISIIQPSNNISLTPTSAGVARINVGVYEYDYQIGINSPIGVWNDIWSGTLLGIPIIGQFSFVVVDTQLPAVNSDGYMHIGDEIGFNYSQNAIRNINILLKTLKARLNSSGKSLAKDANGNQIYVDCDIFSVDMLVTFLANSITLFNEIPHFTFFTFDDTDIIQGFHDVIVQGATLMALSSKALIERGREFQIQDNGLSWSPPTVSEMLNTQYSTELANHTEKLKYIKSSMKPQGLGLGTINIAASRNPIVSALRHRRARQVI